MPKDILQEIVAHKRQELERFRRELPEAELRRRVEPMLTFSVPSLRQALADSPTGIIAEFKRRSPSKGWIKQDGRADLIPLAYQQHGAAALSILTDEHYFGGSDEFIRTARHAGVHIPVLYKNFVIDPYQLLQARLCGASAVLLIAACLTLDECSALLAEAHELGLEVLLEMHADHELQYAALGPDLCGINNRNLGSFVTDVHNSFRLADQLRQAASAASPAAPTAPTAAGGFPAGTPAGTVPPVLVSESGISDPQTVRQLRQAGFRGFLIGETFMKTPDPGQALADFINSITTD